MIVDTSPHTSAQALHKISNGARKTTCDMILDVVTRTQRCGGRDMSMKEIQRDINTQYGRWLDVSTISARVNELMAGNKLQRTTEPRRCTVSGATIGGLSVPLTQASI